MNDIRKAVNMALDALDSFHSDGNGTYDTWTAYEALRQVLAQPKQECTCLAKDMPFGKCCKTQPKQEPVARVDYNRNGNIAWLYGPIEPDGTLLYTSPPKREWVGLTDEDKREFASAQYGWEDLLAVAEAKLKEKNT